MTERGYDIFMYDPTIDTLPATNDRFHFFRQGIAGFEFPNQSLNTLDNFVKLNGNSNRDDMILKMDVEGAEWSFLSTVSPELLSRFDQLIFEFHDLTEHKNSDAMDATLACLNKINQTHSLVHLHANNCKVFIILDDKILMPNILELTYIKTANYTLADDEEIFLPKPFDEPNNPYRNEIPLGFWNRRFNNIASIDSTTSA